MNLPEELNVKVLSELDAHSLVTGRLTCKFWFSLITEAFLENYCHTKFTLHAEFEKPKCKSWWWMVMAKTPIPFSRVASFTGIGFNGTHEGEWKEGVLHGFGRTVSAPYPKGVVYEGEFCAGQRNGQGRMHKMNGTWYEGQFEMGMRVGVGCYHWPSGCEYRGDFVDDGVHEGKGRFTWTNGDYYEGDWVGNAREGKGALHLVSGASYVGDWEDDCRQGVGTYTWDCGNVYVGEWVRDVREGTGKLTWANGNSYDGEWRQSQKVNGVWFEKISARTFSGGFDERVQGNFLYDRTLIHPIVQKAIDEKRCTFTVTGRDCYFQFLYKVRENDGKTHGLCMSCYEECRKVNKIQLLGDNVFFGGNFYCECGAGELAYMTEKSCICQEAQKGESG